MSAPRPTTLPGPYLKIIDALERGLEDMDVGNIGEGKGTIRAAVRQLRELVAALNPVGRRHRGGT
jgi:hypothetical protein